MSLEELERLNLPIETISNVLRNNDGVSLDMVCYTVNFILNVICL